MSPQPSAKAIRDSFERPTVWGEPEPSPVPLVVLLAAVLRLERKAA